MHNFFKIFFVSLYSFTIFYAAYWVKKGFLTTQPSLAIALMGVFAMIVTMLAAGIYVKNKGLFISNKKKEESLRQFIFLDNFHCFIHLSKLNTFYLSKAGFDFLAHTQPTDQHPEILFSKLMEEFHYEYTVNNFVLIKLDKRLVGYSYAAEESEFIIKSIKDLY